MLCAEEMHPTRPFPVDKDLKAQEILIEMIRRQDSARDAETGARNRLDVLGDYRLGLPSLAVVILVLDGVGIVDFDLGLQITQTCHPSAPRKAEGKEAEILVAKSATHSSMLNAVTLFTAGLNPRSNNRAWVSFGEACPPQARVPWVAYL
jgi:hypothetical protein